jgi:Tfp pilus tip-associated adhesin PilY1
MYVRGGGSGQIYDQPSVSKDPTGNVWVYWATGNKAEPIALGGGTDQFYAVKDVGLSGTVDMSSLENITSSNSYADDPSKRGWYIEFTGMGERCISEPAVFAGIVYFTTYTPAAAIGGDMCNNAGTAKLYAVSYLSGAGSLTGGARSMTLGVGIPTAPVLSINPHSNTPDLYVTLSGGAGTGATTMRANVNPPSIANRTNLIHWRDRRFQ